MKAAFDLHKKGSRFCNKRLDDDPCTLKQECEYYNNLTAEQKFHTSTTSYKVCKDKKNEKKSSTPTLFVDAALVKVVGETDASASVQKLASEKKKPTPAKESSKKRPLPRLLPVMISRCKTLNRVKDVQPFKPRFLLEFCKF